MSVFVNVNKINEICNNINQIHNSMIIELENISNLKTKIGTAWTGAGAASFMEKYKELCSCFESVTTELNKVNLFYKLKAEQFNIANQAVIDTYGG